MADETSIWKKEISFKRKPKKERSTKAAAPAPSPVTAKKPEQSVWKKKISFGRKRKATKQAAAQPAPPSVKRAEPSIGVTMPPLSVPASPVAEVLRPVAPQQEIVHVDDLVPEAAEHRKPSRAERKQQAQEEKAAAKEAALAAKHAPRDNHPRHKKLVGLKIGATQISAAEIHNNGSAKLMSVAQAPLEAGVVVGGELREPDALARALRTFFRKNKLPRAHVRLGIANNRIAVRVFDIAGIDDPKQLANAIRFRAQDALPIPLDEAVLDWRVLGETMGPDDVLTRRVLLVVAHRELVERYVAACKKAGVKLVGIDLEAFALLRALTPPGASIGAGEDAGLVVVSIGHERSNLAVSDGAACEFTRVLEWGGAAIGAAIASALELGPEQVERIKRSLSLAEGAEAPEGLAPELAEKARAAVRAELHSFARELIASLRFYQDQPGSLGIAEIVLTGGSSQLPGLAEELGRLIGVDVRVGDAGLRVKINRKLRKQELGGSLAAAIGLGIED